MINLFTQVRDFIFLEPKDIGPKQTALENSSTETLQSDIQRVSAPDNLSLNVPFPIKKEEDQPTSLAKRHFTHKPSSRVPTELVAESSVVPPSKKKKASKTPDKNILFKDFIQKKFLAYAKELYAKKDYEQAEKYLDLIISKEPTLEVLRMKVDICMNSNKHKEAIIVLDEILKVMPNHVESLTNRAIAFYETNRRDLALNDFNHALAIDPDNTTNLQSRAHLLFELNQFDQVLVDVDRILHLDGDKEHIYRLKIVTLLNRKSFVTAGNLLEHLVTIYPDNPFFLNSLGIAYKNLRLTRDAIKSFRLALTKEDKDEKLVSYCQLAEIYYNSKNYEEAVKFYTLALELNPKDNELIMGKAKALNRLKKYSEALFELSGISKWNCEFLKIRMEAFYGIEEYESAIRDCTLILEDDKEDFFTLFTRSHCYLYTKQFELSLKDISVLYQLNPKSKDCLLLIATNYYELKEYKEAVQYYLEVLKEDPENSRALMGISKTFFKLKLFKKGNKALDSFLKLKPGHIEALAFKELYKEKLNKIK